MDLSSQNAQRWGGEALRAPLIVGGGGDEAAHAAFVAAGFLRIELLTKVIQGVIEKVLPKSRACLGAPTYHAHLVDVEVACAGPAVKGCNSLSDQALAVIVGLSGEASHLALRFGIDLKFFGREP